MAISLEMKKDKIRYVHQKEQSVYSMRMFPEIVGANMGVVKWVGRDSRYDFIKLENENFIRSAAPSEWCGTRVVGCG